MKTVRPLCVLFICTLLALSGCNLGQATPTVIQKGGGGGGGGGPCSGTPVAALRNAPPQWSIQSDMTPELNWVYTDPGCTPDSYNVHLSSGPFFQDDLGGSSVSTSWSPASDLLPATEFNWGVEAVNDGITGSLSSGGVFFTGPVCTETDLPPAYPLAPLNNFVVHDLSNFSLVWDHPAGCLPQHYWVGLTTNLDFNNSPLSGTTQTAATHWSPSQPLTDCTRYYWTVRPVVGNSMGPWSSVYTFRVEISGGCPADTSSLIQGTVWEDQCSGLGNATPDPNALPLGCVLNGDVLSANGTYDPGEPGIPGVIVDLNQGACPSDTVLRDVPTGPDGMYNFYMVSPGAYCLSIHSNTVYNIPALQPGNWTYPPDGVGKIIARQDVTVTAGQNLTSEDFGWWYKTGTPWGDTSATVFGQVWSDLCVYHQGDPAPDPLPAGCVHDGSGVHGDMIKQASEPGIAGVTVDIGPGYCPSAGLATAVTDSNGYYHFDGLPAGKYCLRIDPDHGSPNESILLPGMWTYIPSGHEGMSFRAITLLANHTLAGQNFGWDFDDPISTPTPVFTFTPTLIPFPQPFLTLDINANCRKGPGTQYEGSAVGMAGQSFHIEAVSQDSQWMRVRFSDAIRCWMAKSTGAITGSLLDVPVLLVPTDTPTAVPYCVQFTTQRMCIAHGSAGCKWDGTSTSGKCVGP